MCGRFSLATTKDKITKTLNLDIKSDLIKRFNISPTESAYIITSDIPKQLTSCVWGLVPNWAKNNKNTGALINARSEGIEEKASFREPLATKRCLVPADSFYEWRKEGKQKIPYRIFRKNESLLIMAGIWDIWSDGKKELRTFSIITTSPNEEMSSIHNRMPLIFTNQQQWNSWLDDIPLAHVLQLVKTPVPNYILSSYRVSEKLNKSGYESPDLHLPISEKPTLFDEIT